MGGLVKVVYSPPEIFSAEQITPAFVRASLLIVAAFSILVYALRVFLKLAMSNAHLRSDALERAKLTQAYLAMINDKAESIPDQHKEIILQALFSRSDSGLLKDDGKPDFPMSPSINVGKLAN